MKSTNYLARFFCTLLCTFIGISAALASNTTQDNPLKQNKLSGIYFLIPRMMVVPYAGKTIETTAKRIVANLSIRETSNSTKATNTNNINNDGGMTTEAKSIACQAPACTPVTVIKTKSL